MSAPFLVHVPTSTFTFRHDEATSLSRDRTLSEPMNLLSDGPLESEDLPDSLPPRLPPALLVLPRNVLLRPPRLPSSDLLEPLPSESLLPDPSLFRARSADAPGPVLVSSLPPLLTILAVNSMIMMTTVTMVMILVATLVTSGLWSPPPGGLRRHGPLQFRGVTVGGRPLHRGLLHRPVLHGRLHVVAGRLLLHGVVGRLHFFGVLLVSGLLHVVAGVSVLHLGLGRRLQDVVGVPLPLFRGFVSGLLHVVAGVLLLHGALLLGRTKGPGLGLGRRLQGVLFRPHVELVFDRLHVFGLRLHGVVRHLHGLVLFRGLVSGLLHVVAGVLLQGVLFRLHGVVGVFAGVFVFRLGRGMIGIGGKVRAGRGLGVFLVFVVPPGLLHGARGVLLGHAPSTRFFPVENFADWAKLPPL